MTIQLPDFDKAWDYENHFYLSCGATRLSKVMAHFELYKKISNLPGAVVECGVFKGASLVRFAMFREMLGSQANRKIIGFDIFGKFPSTNFEEDLIPRQKFIDSAGEESISIDQLRKVLDNKGLDQNIELVKGDITVTAAEYLRNNPELKISLLNLDTDIYEPAVTVLEVLYPCIVSGGVLVLDDYGVFPGETKAVDDYFARLETPPQILKFPYAATPCYVVKP